MKNILLTFYVLFSFGWATPPATIPAELHSQFTMNGNIPVSYWYFDDSVSNGEPIKYTYHEVEALKAKASRRENNYYGSTDSYLYSALDRSSSRIRGKQIGIIGSVTPWYEAIVLAYGGHPVSIDYNKIISDHPEIKALTVQEYDKDPILFDAIISISSIEHDGLGRYGDPINPNGDLEAMQKLKKMLKPNGLLFLAVPIGQDYLFWNAHRVYGKKRLPLLINGWNLIKTFGFKKSQLDQYTSGDNQPVFVLSQ